MTFQILNGAGLDGVTLLQQQQDYLTFNHQGRMIRIPTGSIAKIEKNEEFKKETFFTIVFTNQQAARAKSMKKDYEEIYKLQFHSPKVPFVIYEYTPKDFWQEHKKTFIIFIGLTLLVAFVWLLNI